MPGLSSANRAKFRPLSGRLLTRFWSTTCPNSEVSVSSSGAAPVTSISSDICPTCRAMLMAMRSCTFSSTTSDTAFLKPAFSTVTL